MGAGGPSAPAGWVLRWAMVAWRRRPFFLLVGMLDWCPCLLGTGVKEGGSSMVAIVPWSKMMTCLRLVAVFSAAGVFSQVSGMMTQGSGDPHGLWLS
jgi:hypothetical protein